MLGRPGLKVFITPCFYGPEAWRLIFPSVFLFIECYASGLLHKVLPHSEYVRTQYMTAVIINLRTVYLVQVKLSQASVLQSLVTREPWMVYNCYFQLLNQHRQEYEYFLNRL